MSIYCLSCRSSKVEEIVEENRVFYLCNDCQKKSGRALIVDNKIKIINTSRGIKHIAIGALIIRDNALLLEERRTYPFGLEIPAGHLEYGESLEEALHREVYEEVGLKIKGYTLLAQLDYTEPICRYGSDIEEWALYLVDCPTGEPFINNNEAEALIWVPIKNIPTDKLTPLTHFALRSLGYIFDRDQNKKDLAKATIS